MQDFKLRDTNDYYDDDKDEDEDKAKGKSVNGSMIRIESINWLILLEC